jgi:hypothetical protein
MGRSGTSLTARILNFSGVDLGPEADMLEPVPGDNDRGYWEQRRVRQLNDEVLGVLGGTWWQPPPMPASWEKTPELAPLRRAGERLVSELFDGSRLWGWKDPRNSLTLPFWRQIVPTLRYVICIRSPADVAASLLSRDPIAHPFHETTELWVRYTSAALRNTEGDERIIVFYEDYFPDPFPQASRLADFLGPAAKTTLETLRDGVSEFFTGRLRRHHTPDDDLVARGDVAAEAAAQYLLLRAVQAQSEECEGTPSDVALRFAARFDDVLAARQEERRKTAQELEAAEARADAERLARERKVADREARAAELEQALTCTQAQLAVVYGSRSWQLTEPLRRAADAVRSRHTSPRGERRRADGAARAPRGAP